MSAPARALPQLRFTPEGQKIYEPDGEVLGRFLLDRSHVSIIRGPWGSGKTLAVINKIWQIACEQARSPLDGLRKTRWGVVRNHYGELRDTTLKDVIDWLPPAEYGNDLKLSRPMIYHLRLGDVSCELIFIALDGPEDVQKLMSTHFTGFWFHEMQFTAKQVFDDAEGRTGRYPPVRDGGPTWHGILGDMNEPGEDHWLVRMTHEVPLPVDMTPEERERWHWPKEWAYFVQPPALIEVFHADGKTLRGYRINPAAENTLWLPPGFYREKITGKDRRWIDSRLMNRISVWVDGEPVWRGFSPETHVAKEALKPIAGLTLYVGLDFGRSPAAVLGQRVGTRWQILDEIVAFDVDSSEFAPMLKRKLAEPRYAGITDIRIYGDPKGTDKFQSTERTSYDIFESFGLHVIECPCNDNDIELRVNAVADLLRRMENGAPCLLLDPARVPTLKTAMAGRYHRERIKGADGVVKEIPKKDRYSNVADALQYMVLGAGEGRTLLGKSAQTAARVVRLPPRRQRFTGARRPF